MFADRAKIYISSGKGGDGHVSFRRELYVPDGGPDGGDGGNGGDVIFVVDEGMNTLNDYRHKQKYKAGDGEEGGKRRCHGKNGSDIILKVPPGTVIKDFESGKVILDMANKTEPQHLLKGGRGGKGNMHYVTSVMQAPKYAQPGKPAQELMVTLELKVIADVGLVGFPNVGKSTFLSATTNARPKIANYHFTTLNPNLGMVDLGEDSFCIADIPGIIEGASEGIGLGLEFLRHIERCRVIVHMVDAAGVEGRDPIADIKAINKEIESYNPEILTRPQVIAANKIDALFDIDEAVSAIRKEFEPTGVKVYPISAVSGEGVKELKYHIAELLKQCPRETLEFEQEFELNFDNDNDDPIICENPEPHVFSVNGERVERMLGYTNLDDERGFDFFQKFMKDNGIIEELKALGLEEGDTVRVSDLEFEYYE
ncbi:MAG: GTPase ObgE [Lachnospiraceae bacterium]|nr:GTPase ObgE [Lachnospiraceae bacterium]